MQTDSKRVETATSSADDYLRMHGYWLHGSCLGQDTLVTADDATSLGSGSALKDAGLSTAGQLGGSYYYPGSMLLPVSRGPLVEDDQVDDDDDDEKSDADEDVSFGYYLHSNGKRAELVSPQPLTSAELSAPSSRIDSTASAAATTLEGECESEYGVPVLEEESLGDLGDIIGYGGDRGSFVCRVALPALLQVLHHRAASYVSPWSLSSPARREREAYKRYPTQISDDEVCFVTTAYSCAANSARCQSAHSPFLTVEEAQYAALHLVLPDAVVTQQGKKVGLLMPLYNCSLKEYLQSLRSRGPQRSPSPRLSRQGSACPQDTSFSEEGRSGAFNSTVKYLPVESVAVVTAIAFQVLEAIAYLNHRLPHGDGFTGYTHNDLHLDNVLLSYDGDVALCDFELVASTPSATHSGAVRRLPPSSRQSPYGLFSETADTWAFGLMVVGLLTGVDPLFTTSIVNDFSDGPQLSRWDGEKCVLDWEANIKDHVEGLLRQQDPTGQRLEEVQGILELCGKCLVNNGRAEPLRAVDLLEEPLFRVYRQDFQLATRTVREWTAETRS